MLLQDLQDNPEFYFDTHEKDMQEYRGKVKELHTFPNGDTSCWSAATLSPILSFFSCSNVTFFPRQERCETDGLGSRTFDDMGGAVLVLWLFLGFFDFMVPNSSGLAVAVTPFPLK
jgi:hypothetical protein